MFNSQWEEKIFDKRRSFSIDQTFIRPIFIFYGFSLIERIRIVQYPDKKQPLLIYSKKVGSSSSKTTNRLFRKGFNSYKIFYKVLGKIFNKSDQTYEIRNSKYMRYPFVKNLFRDIVRDEKLEQLLK